jgi:hypothetical protein
MRPVDESYGCSPPGTAKARSSSVVSSSRSPSPGVRGAASASSGGMTYFLTEENNFGVHSLTESVLPNTSRGQPVPAETVVKSISRRVMDGHALSVSVGSNLSVDVSLPSSPRQNLSSTAVSDDDDDLDLNETTEVTISSLEGSFPQLVMPRVTMPRRKSFTEAGRTMGNLKVMVVGDSGEITYPKANLRDR